MCLLASMWWFMLSAYVKIHIIKELKINWNWKGDLTEIQAEYSGFQWPIY